MTGRQELQFCRALTSRVSHVLLHSIDQQDPMYVEAAPTAQFRASHGPLSHLSSILTGRQHRLSFPRFGSDTALLNGKGNSLRAALLHVDTKPDDQRCGCTESESESQRESCSHLQEGETHPAVAGFVDDCGDDIWSDQRRGTIGDAEETEEHCDQRVTRTRRQEQAPRRIRHGSFFTTRNIRKYSLPSYPGGHKSDIIVCEYA